MEGENQGGRSMAEIEEEEMTKSWQELLGPQPTMGDTKVTRTGVEEYRNFI